MRVLVVDDQRVIREGLATILGGFPSVDVVGLATNGLEAVQMAGELAPDVILMDLRMPQMDGVEATAAITDRYPALRIVVLTTYADDESVVAALTAGAFGYVTKDSTKHDILRALEAAVAGQAILDSTVQHALVSAARTRPVRPTTLPDGLTDREAEVLSLIAEGCSTADIAERLYVAESTVKTHVNRIFAKTGSRDRAQAAAYAHRIGLTP